jgi:hypothetical protein
MVTGTVLSDDGHPLQGVLVMGEDLNYAETDEEGRFELRPPEAALFFWCSGFRPAAVPVRSGLHDVQVRMETLGRR